MAYTVPPAAICAASMATEPLPAPISHTMLVGPRSISASAIERTSAGVSRPCLGFDCKNASSGLPNSRRPIASLGRSGTFGRRTRIITLSGEKSCVGDFRQFALRHALVGRAEVLADVGREIIDPPIQQRLGHGLRRAGRRW